MTNIIMIFSDHNKYHFDLFICCRNFFWNPRIGSQIPIYMFMFCLIVQSRKIFFSQNNLKKTVHCFSFITPEMYEIANKKKKTLELGKWNPNLFFSNFQSNVSWPDFTCLCAFFSITLVKASALKIDKSIQRSPIFSLHFSPREEFNCFFL